MATGGLQTLGSQDSSIQKASGCGYGAIWPAHHNGEPLCVMDVGCYVMLKPRSRARLSVQDREVAYTASQQVQHAAEMPQQAASVS